MKSLMLLWQEVALEYATMCNTSTSRDIETVAARSEHEGFEFFTLSLPQFGKDFERSLDCGVVTRNLFQGFAFGTARLPKFLRGFTELVFDRTTGRLVDEPDADSIRAVRQLTLMYGKVEALPTDRRIEAAIEGFVDCERDVKISDTSREASFDATFGRVSNLLWGETLARVENDLYSEWTESWSTDQSWPYVIPKHGPGNTSDRLTGNGKFDLFEWSDRLETLFPFGDYALPSQRYHNRNDRVDYREPGAERPVRVVSVPKTMKTPRLIAQEPSYMQFMQQAIMSILVPAIESNRLLPRVVGFSDQWRNNAMACEGSLKGDLATLDLSEASDRVSNQLVRTMMDSWPLLQEAVDVTRSRLADVPGHGIRRLSKFASMGSALTFPIEAMVFTTVIFVGLERMLRRPLTRADIKSARAKVRVFGDDLIVPVETVEFVVQALEDFGLKVNLHKSFWTGKFRESCGKEYYAGHDVSIVRVRKVVFSDDSKVTPELPTQRTHVREIESMVALRNRFYLSGMWSTAAWLDERIERVLDRSFPPVAITSSILEEGYYSRSRLLGRSSFLASNQREWTLYDLMTTDPLHRGSTEVALWSRLEAERLEWTVSDIKTQQPLIRGWVVTDKIPKSTTSGIGALLKVLNPKRVLPYEDEQHLERAGRPSTVYMKRTWTPTL